MAGHLADEMLFEQLPLARIQQALPMLHIICQERGELARTALLTVERNPDDQTPFDQVGRRLMPCTLSASWSSMTCEVASCCTRSHAWSFASVAASACSTRARPE